MSINVDDIIVRPLAAHCDNDRLYWSIITIEDRSFCKLWYPDQDRDVGLWGQGAHQQLYLGSCCGMSDQWQSKLLDTEIVLCQIMTTEHYFSNTGTERYSSNNGTECDFSHTGASHYFIMLKAIHLPARNHCPWILVHTGILGKPLWCLSLVRRNTLRSVKSY